MEPDQPNKTRPPKILESTDTSQKVNVSKPCKVVSLTYLNFLTETSSMSKPSLCERDTKPQDQCHQESEAEDRAIGEEETSTGSGSNREEENYVNSGREKLERHRSEVAGRVWIPETWGHEELLKDWIDCSAFDASLVPTTQRIMSAPNALVQQHTNTSSSPISQSRIRIVNRC